MTLSETAFHLPHTIAEAFRLLQEHDGARLVAGGTDLLVDIKQGLVQTGHLVSLQEIEELKGIDIESGRVRIGAMVTPLELLENPVIRESFPALSDAARSMASPQVRAIATIGGNIRSAVPSADLPPVLLAADACLRLECADSCREVMLKDFFSGPRETVCREREILISVSIPVPPPHTGISYQKFCLREANALAVASSASRLTLEEGRVAEARIALGAVAPTPLLAARASEMLRRQEPSQDLFEKAARAAAEEAKPISDIRGSAWYRKELIEILTVRSLTQALSRARGQTEKSK